MKVFDCFMYFDEEVVLDLRHTSTFDQQQRPGPCTSWPGGLRVVGRRLLMGLSCKVHRII